MRISTKSRYGARAVLDIALHGGQRPVTLNEISARQGISKKYLEQIIHRLLKAGVLVSVRGPRGGYLLGRPAARIQLGEIIRSLDGSVAPVRCVDEPERCDRTGRCVTRDVWTEIKESVESVIDRISVADLASRQNALDDLLPGSRQKVRPAVRVKKKK